MPTLNFGPEDNLKRVIFYQYNAALISRAVPKFDSNYGPANLFRERLYTPISECFKVVLNDALLTRVKSLKCFNFTTTLVLLLPSNTLILIKPKGHTFLNSYLWRPRDKFEYRWIVKDAIFRASYGRGNQRHDVGSLAQILECIWISSRVHSRSRSQNH